MSTANPNIFTTSDIIAAQCILLSNTPASIKGQIDLTGKIGAYLQAACARIATSAYTNGIDLIIQRLFGTTTGSSPTATSNRRAVLNRLGTTFGTTAAGAVTTQLNANTAVGDTSLVIKTANTGLTAYGSLGAILGATAPGSLTHGQAVTGFELFRMSSSSGSGPWTLQVGTPLGVVHSSNDYVTSAAEEYQVWLPGGFIYDVEFDASNIAAGTGAVIRAAAQIYASDNIA